MKLQEFYDKVNTQQHKINVQENFLFATPVYTTKFTEDTTEFKQYLQNIAFFEKDKSTGVNTQSTNNFLLNEKLFANLKIFVQNTLDFVCAKQLRTTNKLRITQSWANLTAKNHFHHPHKHPNRLLSGVFFLNTKKEHPPLIFLSSMSSAFHMERFEENLLTVDQHALLPTDGDLVIFPSNLMHYVPVNTIDEPRISISFNTFAVDSLGQKNNLTYLDLPRGKNV
jgi:uncharacterized protein (TIGR02466 family)